MGILSKSKQAVKLRFDKDICWNCSSFYDNPIGYCDVCGVKKDKRASVVSRSQIVVPVRGDSTLGK